MIYHARKGQQSYGEAIGILLIDYFAPFVPGDVGNATTYSYPVRYKVIEGWTFGQLCKKDKKMRDKVVEAAKELEREGVRAITGDCGFMAQYQQELTKELDVPVFMSSLLQVPFMSRMLRSDEKVGIVCVDSVALDDSLLEAVGIDKSYPIHIKGLENKEHFHQAVIEESGIIDTAKMEEEVVSVVKELVEEDPKVKIILLECSMLPPYAAAVQEAVNLPVFDFITMIDYVFSAVVKKRFNGFL